jgi:hypothetical protein
MDKAKSMFRAAREKRASTQGRTDDRGPQPESTAVSPTQPPASALFDGSEESFKDWRHVGAGTFERRGDELYLSAGSDSGLVYFAAHRFGDLRLRFQYRLDSADAAMTLAARFLDPRQPVPDREDPAVRYPYENQAYVAADTGFEVELGVQRRGVDPGTFHGVLLGDAPGAQLHVNDAPVRLDDWNDFELDVVGDVYAVRINGQETARFTNLDDYRSKPAIADSNAGFIGFLMRRGQIALRRVMLEQPGLPEGQERAPDFVGAEGGT